MTRAARTDNHPLYEIGYREDELTARSGSAVGSAKGPTSDDVLLKVVGGFESYCFPHSLTGASV
jgi:hypothetical protein